MPFKIDAFKSSPAVRAMHPAARAGYLYLLTFAWQTDDCTIPSDPFELAEISELGDELWALHGPRILRKFDTVTVRSPSPNGTVTVADRLRNVACFAEWSEAKRIFDRRRDAAIRTTEIRSPREEATVTVEEMDGHRLKSERSADTRTRAGAPALVPVSVPVSVPVDVSVAVNGESGSELGLAAWIFEEANVPCDNSLVRVAGDCIRKLAREAKISNRDAALVILEAARRDIADGEQIVRFWFTDQRYKPRAPTKSHKQRDKDARIQAFLAGGSDD